MIRKIIAVIVIITLTSSCAVTPKQINSNREIKKAVRLCVEAFPIANNSYNSSYQIDNYKLFIDIKNKYPKEWEEFKKKNKNRANVYYGKASESDAMDNIWGSLLMTIFTFGIAPTFHGVNLIMPAGDDAKTYPQLLELCDEKMPSLIEEAKKQAEIDEKMRPERERLAKEEEKRRKAIWEAEQKKLKKSLTSKTKNNVVDEHYGLETINGPVSSGYYSNVYIKSETVGIMADGPVTVKNSVIEAPVCIVSNSGGVRVSDSTLDCDLCVEFRSRISFGNVFLWNQCNGKSSNRPDLF